MITNYNTSKGALSYHGSCLPGHTILAGTVNKSLEAGINSFYISYRFCCFHCQ